MCNQVQSVTLQTAVLMQVKEFASAGQAFSVHDITTAIRNKTAQGELEIPEVEVSGASFHFDIPHSKVKALFLEMWNSGVFDPDFSISRNFNRNGGYFEYSPTPVGGPYATTTVTPGGNPTATATTPMTTTVSRLGNSDVEVIDRVKLYLSNCEARSFRPTLKQVQSAIKRTNVSTGWSCEDLDELITTSLGYSILAGRVVTF